MRYPSIVHRMSDRARPRLLVLGSRGQVGWELVRTLAPLGDVVPIDRAALDLENPGAVRETLRSVAGDVIVNAAGYTQVDLAESEPEVAHRINADAPALLAEEARRADALLVHFSTDYVFSGAGTQPYGEEDEAVPATAYGRSKLAGDQAILGSSAAAYIFRIAWVYGWRRRNFLTAIEHQTHDRDVLRVVNDQHGSPSWSRVIAEAAALAVAQWLRARRDRRERREPPPSGVYHMAAPDHTTWHAFASAIVGALPFPVGRARPVVVPITTAEYPMAAQRPAWSVLNSSRLRKAFGLVLPPWQDQLALCMDADVLAGVER